MSESESDYRDPAFEGLDAESDEIEILEVVGLDEDSPAGSPIDGNAGDSDAVEYVLDLDDPPKLDPLSDEPGDVGQPDAGLRFQRLQADFENFKRRVEKERKDHENHATTSLVSRLLPVLDNFERAVSSLPHESGEALMDGVTLIFRQLLDELRKEGLNAIESVGQVFDPTLHDALETESEPGQADYVVVEELQRGYKFHGRLLRPALVKVAVAGSDDESEGEGQ